MADIMNGTSEHLKFAPLSQGQTVALCKHLQDQISSLESRMHQVQDALRGNQDATGGLAAKLAKETGRVDMLKDGLGAAQLGLEATSKGVGQVSNDLQRVQAGLNSSNGAIDSLRASQNKLGATLQNTGREASHTAARLQKLQEAVETSVLGEIAKLRDELASTGLRLGRVHETTELLSSNAQKAKEHIKGLDLSIRGLSESLTKTNGQVEVQNQRLGDTGKRLGSTQQLLDEVKANTLRLRDNQRQLGVNVGELQDGMKQLHNEHSETRKFIERTAGALQGAQGMLHRTAGEVEAAKAGLSDALDHIQELRSSSEVMNSVQTDMAKKLDHTQMLAVHVKNGLSQTNSIVLPNLQLESNLPVSMPTSPMPSVRRDRGRSHRSSIMSTKEPLSHRNSLISTRSTPLSPTGRYTSTG